ncbi:MarR family winged helix-turn-helix transcriptional regulator [Paenibacillus sp. IHBB 10380]|jgi:DNA-binding MarR family transcriptional regulator|uniref:MarR family winged helix-turn-helix transcriptional regulator n=1 Tax=Paenibacillus sp. IHBB 10380 TaxID=1566358 RepID=UPI0005CFDCB8|nr:MarR family winged helix-turn-helix transcriptional regulator [Paenibacillus sp. IHBB 10380]AJS60471.1 MarR family transcriptional regulator [Paenibacillus sp. IHBB 10380]
MNNTTAETLFRAMMRFNKAEFRNRLVEGVKPSELLLMFCVKKKMKPDTTGLMVSEISELLGVTSPTVTQLLKSLEAKDWIDRTMDQLDRRAVRIKLSDKGEEVIKAAMEATEASFNGLIQYLGEEDSNQLAKLLVKAYEYFESDDQKLTQGGDDKQC